VIAAGIPGYSLPPGVSAGLEHTATFSPAQSTYSNGSHVAEVEVDIETGYVRILRYVVGHDCGRIINPKVVNGQVVGGVVHGIGNALFEHIRYDDQGQPLTVHFGDYLLPQASDVPRIEVLHMESLTSLNPLGIKGAGEGGTLPASATIISAIEDALSPFQVKINETPISPQRLFELLGDAALGRTK
jgi:carbon-monoxide dehydrogenase large subunit